METEMPHEVKPGGKETRTRRLVRKIDAQVWVMEFEVPHTVKTKLLATHLDLRYSFASAHNTG